MNTKQGTPVVQREPEIPARWRGTGVDCHTPLGGRSALERPPVRLRILLFVDLLQALDQLP